MGTDTPVIKIIVAGPFGAGKTTLIRAVASGRVLGSEAQVSDSTAALKTSTTVGMDHTVLTLDRPDGDVTISLFGAPGQERFAFMWPTLAQGMHAYVMVVDASRLQAMAQLKGSLRQFAQFAPGVPYLVAANRWDQESLSREELASFLDVDPGLVVACDSRDGGQGREVLHQLLERVVHDALIHR